MKPKILFVSILLFAEICFCQNLMQSDSAGSFRIGAEIGGGYGYKLKNNNTLPGNYSRSGFVSSLRLKWGSGNKIGAGIETGWLPISSLEGGTVASGLTSYSIKASLNSLPVIVFAGLQLYNIQLHSGIGYYKVFATTTVAETTCESSEWDFGYMVSLGYIFPFNSSFKFGTEVKWYNITEIQASIISLQLKLLFKLYDF